MNMVRFLEILFRGLCTLTKIVVVAYVLLWLVGGMLIPAWEMFVLKK